MDRTTTRRYANLVMTAVTLGTLMLAFAIPAEAQLGSPKGARAQVVASGFADVDVAIVNCEGICVLLWHAVGPATLTLRCLDNDATSTGVWATSYPRVDHPCILESTLERNGALESVVVWRANSCDAPECGSWPSSALP